MKTIIIATLALFLSTSNWTDSIENRMLDMQNAKKISESKSKDNAISYVYSVFEKEKERKVYSKYKESRKNLLEQNFYFDGEQLYAHTSITIKKGKNAKGKTVYIATERKQLFKNKQEGIQKYRIIETASTSPMFLIKQKLKNAPFKESSLDSTTYENTMDAFEIEKNR